MNNFSMIDKHLRRFIECMPKVELHVHLEGSIDPFTVRKLATLHNENIDHIYEFRDFAGFLSAYKRVCGLLRRPEDFELITYEFLETLAGQNVKYAEIFISPSIHKRNGLPMDEVLENVFRARDRGYKELAIQANFVLDAVRQWGVEEVEALVDLAIEYNKHGVIGIGIGGDEIAAPPELFAEPFARAKKHGLGLSAHAGEVAGAQSVLRALEILEVDRIEHGIKAVEDERLIDRIAKRKVPLDLCLTSNLKTGALHSLEAHPFRKLFDLGAQVTLNSDDPAIFDTTLTKEYFLLAEIFGFGTGEIQQLLLNGIQASFLPPDKKAKFEHSFRNQLEALH